MTSGCTAISGELLTLTTFLLMWSTCIARSPLRLLSHSRISSRPIDRVESVLHILSNTAFNLTVCQFTFVQWEAAYSIYTPCFNLPLFDVHA